MKLKQFASILLFVLLSLGSFPLIGQDLYDKESSLRFADYLFKTERFSESVAEYERVIFLGDDSERTRLKLLKAMDLAGESEAALGRLSSWYKQLSEVPLSMSMFYIKSQYRKQRYDLLLLEIPQMKKLEAVPTAMLTSSIYLHQLNWDSALLPISDLERLDAPLGIKQRSLLEKGQSLPRKSPFIAAALSAIVPGSGKVYSGRWQDGLLSFLIVSSTAWLSYRSFDSDGSSSVRGWIFGGIATGFYLGNIYGSQKAAKNVNQRYIKVYQAEVDRHFMDHFSR